MSWKQNTMRGIRSNSTVNQPTGGGPKKSGLAASNLGGSGVGLLYGRTYMGGPRGVQANYRNKNVVFHYKSNIGGIGHSVGGRSLGRMMDGVRSISTFPEPTPAPIPPEPIPPGPSPGPTPLSHCHGTYYSNCSTIDAEYCNLYFTGNLTYVNCKVNTTNNKCENGDQCYIAPTPAPTPSKPTPAPPKPTPAPYCHGVQNSNGCEALGSNNPDCVKHYMKADNGNIYNCEFEDAAGFGLCVKGDICQPKQTLSISSPEYCQGDLIAPSGTWVTGGWLKPYSGDDCMWAFNQPEGCAPNKSPNKYYTNYGFKNPGDLSGYQCGGKNCERNKTPCRMKLPTQPTPAPDPLCNSSNCCPPFPRISDSDTCEMADPDEWCDYTQLRDGTRCVLSTDGATDRCVAAQLPQGGDYKCRPDCYCISY